MTLSDPCSTRRNGSPAYQGVLPHDSGRITMRSSTLSPPCALPGAAEAQGWAGEMERDTFKPDGAAKRERMPTTKSPCERTQLPRKPVTRSLQKHLSEYTLLRDFLHWLCLDPVSCIKAQHTTCSVRRNKAQHTTCSVRRNKLQFRNRASSKPWSTQGQCGRREHHLQQLHSGTVKAGQGKVVHVHAHPGRDGCPGLRAPRSMGGEQRWCKVDGDVEQGKW